MGYLTLPWALILLGLWNLHVHCTPQSLTWESTLRQKRMVGGEEVRPNEYPWMVWIGRQSDESGVISQFCGGSLISENLILTAASCFNASDPPYKYFAVAGDHDRSKPDTASKQSRDGAAIYIHQQYNATNISNNIALIQVHPPFILTDKVKPGVVPSPPYQEPTDVTTTIGWGSTTPSNPALSNVLRRLTLNHVGDDICEKQYSGFYDNETMLCFSGKEGEGPCFGDTGGPLMCQGDDHELCGIVSFGSNCGTTNVYTDVMAYLDWIRDPIGDENSTQNDNRIR